MEIEFGLVNVSHARSASVIKHNRLSSKKGNFVPRDIYGCRFVVCPLYGYGQSRSQRARRRRPSEISPPPLRCLNPAGEQFRAYILEHTLVQENTDDGQAVSRMFDVMSVARLFDSVPKKHGPYIWFPTQRMIRGNPTAQFRFVISGVKNTRVFPTCSPTPSPLRLHLLHPSKVSDSCSVRGLAGLIHMRFQQEPMFGFQSPEISQPCRSSLKSTNKITKHIRTTSSTFKDNVSKTLKRASRRALSNGLETPRELCSSCVEYVLGRSEDSVHDVSLVTSLSLTFDGSCPQQEFHIARILGVMGGLDRLEVIDVRTTPSFYATLADRAHFQLHYFACASPLFDTLLLFLSSQRQLLEFTYLARSLEIQTEHQVHCQEILHSVQTLNTTSHLLLYPRLNVTSLRHLTYVGGGQSLREEVRAIENIYRLGPQLLSLRFMWGAGRTETFLDVTKFFSIAANTSLIEHLYLSDVSRNVSGFPSTRLVFATDVKIGFRYSSNSSRRLSETRPGINFKPFSGSQARPTKIASTDLNLPCRLPSPLLPLSWNYLMRSMPATLLDLGGNPPPRLGTRRPPQPPSVPPIHPLQHPRRRVGPTRCR